MTSSHRAPPETHYQLAKAALTELLERLGRGGESRLPAEDQLSSELGFSRPTIRSALLELQKEGKLTRRHGVGTLINRHALDIPANLAEDRAFVDVLTDLGYEPSVEILGMVAEPVPSRIAQRLHVPPAEPVCVITRVFNGSGHPAVLSRDYVPVALLQGSFAELTPERSTFAFIARWCGRTVRYSMAEIRSSVPGPPVTKQLGLGDDDGLLLLDHLHIDTEDRPTAVTEAYVNDSVIQFTVIRTGNDM